MKDTLTTSVRAVTHPSLAFPVAYRPVEEADMGFVVKGWIHSYHDGTETMRAVPWTRFKREQRAVIRDCLERGACIVACDPEDPATLYGFAAGWDDLGVGVAHYVYVMQTRRGMGLARALVRELGTACGRTIAAYSHSTVQGAGLARRLRIAHDPFALVRLIYASDSAVRTQAAPGGEEREPAAALHRRGRAGGAGTGDAA